MEPPKVEQLAAEGQTINLTCRVFGSPTPLVVWKKGNEQLTGGRFRVLSNGYLEIDVSGLALTVIIFFRKYQIDGLVQEFLHW